MSGKAVGHGGPVFWARVSEGRMGQGGTLFHKGVTSRVPRAHGSPGSPGTFRSTPAGNTCSPRDRGAWGTGASGNVKNCFKGRKIIFHFRKKYFSRKNLLGRGYFGEKMCPRFPVYPGCPFLCNMAPGKEKKYRRGYRRSKNWAIIFPDTPGYPFLAEGTPGQKIKNRPGGYRRSKNWAIIFRVPRVPFPW